MADRLRELDDDAFDAVVVGAGTGGLVTAAFLARHGRKVLVLDQHSVAGGNATVFSRKGYEFDVGLHYLGGCRPDGPLPRILEAAGVEDLEFLEMDPDGFDTFVFPDFTFRMPRGLEAYRERLVEHFPGERRGIDRYCRLVGQCGRMVGTLGHPFRGLWRLLTSPLLLRSVRTSFSDFLDTCTKDPHLRAVMAGQCGDYALPPSRASALIATGITAHYLEGAFYPRGGGQVISDRLADAIESHGGKILLLSRVDRIVVESGRVAGVEFESRHLGRRFVRAPVVISNADLKRTMFELIEPGRVKERTLQRTRDFEMAPALGIVFLGMRRDLVAENHPVTNYWVYRDYDLDGLYDACRGGKFPQDPSAYISIASVKDPGHPVAPEGITNLQVMALAPSQPEAWGVLPQEVADGEYRKSTAYRETKEAFARSLLESSKRVFPEIEAEIDYMEVATPLTHSRYTGSTGGTSYGIAATPEQFIGTRPGARTEIAGLFLCGASTRTGHGIAGVAISGMEAASAILRRKLARKIIL